MAVEITPVRCKRDASTNVEFTTVGSGETFEIDWNVRGESAAIEILVGAAEAEVEIYPGKGVQGNKSLVLPELTATKYYVIPINSGRFKNDYGDDAGLVKGTTDKQVLMRVVEYDA